MNPLRSLLAALAILGLPALATAAPPRLPVQGTLHDTDGDPIDEPLTVRFALYDDDLASDPVWFETQVVDFADGLFSVDLGQSNPVPLDVFAVADDIWLGITVESDSEMPRVRLGTSPWAAYAAFAGDAQTLEGATLNGVVVTALVEAGSRFSALTHTHAWSTLTGIPAGLADGTDNDLLATLLCAAGEVPRFGPMGWRCDVDRDSFAAFTCSDGQIPRWDGGAWTCSADRDTDTVAALACSAGQTVKFNGSAWACAADIDTNTDTRCDVPGACAQLCVGTACTNRIRGIPHVMSISGNFANGSSYSVPSVTGVATSLTVAIRTFGGDNCAGNVQARWRDAGGAVLRDYTLISGSNVQSGTDGGSGMSDRELATIPLFDGTATVDFQSSGCHDFGGEYIALTYFE